MIKGVPERYGLRRPLIDKLYKPNAMKDQKLNPARSLWNLYERKPYYNKILTRTLLLLLTMTTIFGCRKEEPQTSNSKGIGKSNSASVSGTPGYYSIATYNVRRTTTEAYPQQNWSVRRPLVKDMIIKYSFDIFGVQEPIGTQIDNMVSDLPG